MALIAEIWRRMNAQTPSAVWLQPRRRRAAWYGWTAVSQLILVPVLRRTFDLRRFEQIADDRSLNERLRSVYAHPHDGENSTAS